MKKALLGLFLAGFAVSAGAVVVYTDIVDQKTSVESGGTISTLSLTGVGGDSFDFYITFSGPYPSWGDALTTGGDSQIAMANGYHALISSGADVKSQSTWLGGNLFEGSSFFNLFSGDPNGWRNNTGYVGLRVAQGGGDYIYGWAEFSIVELADPQERSITLTRYAYEDQINTSIATGAVPEPATALTLAIGGVLLGLIRRFHFCD